jgi:hypothetical protein
MLFSIIVGVLGVLILRALIVEDRKSASTGNHTGGMVGTVVMSSLLAFPLTAFIGTILAVFMIIISLTFFGHAHSTSSQVTDKLYSVDSETLNGREFYVVNDDDKTIYITHEKDGATKANTVLTEDIKIYEDEEVEPYVSMTKTTPQEHDYTWYLPFFKIAIGEETFTDPELHIPLKSIKYYVNDNTEIGK